METRVHIAGQANSSVPIASIHSLLCYVGDRLIYIYDYIGRKHG